MPVGNNFDTIFMNVRLVCRRFSSSQTEIRALIEGQMLHHKAVASDMGFHFGEQTRILATGGASANQVLIFGCYIIVFFLLTIVAALSLSTSLIHPYSPFSGDFAGCFGCFQCARLHSKVNGGCFGRRRLSGEICFAHLQFANGTNGARVIL